MNIRKILCAGIAVMLVSVLLSGCFPVIDETEPGMATPLPQETPSGTDAPEEPAGFPAYLEDTGPEKLTVRAEVRFPEGFDGTRKVSVSSASPAAWDMDKVAADFSGGREVTDRYSGENSGPEDLYYVYTYEDGADLSFYSGSVLYSPPQSMEYDYSYYFDYYEDYWEEGGLRKLFPADAIDGLEKSRALDSAGRAVSLLGIDKILGEPEIYAMDAASVNRMQEELDIQGKYGNPAARWTAAQEAYLLVYPILYQDIPSLYLANATGENELLTSSKAYFIYGRDGWIEFSVSGIFEIRDTLREGNTLSPSAAVKAVQQSFENIIMDRDLEIDSLKLVYIIRENSDSPLDWKVEPVWLVRGKYIGDTASGSGAKSGSGNRDYLAVISAVSGETIPVYGIGG